MSVSRVAVASQVKKSVAAKNSENQKKKSAKRKDKKEKAPADEGELYRLQSSDNFLIDK